MYCVILKRSNCYPSNSVHEMFNRKLLLAVCDAFKFKRFISYFSNGVQYKSFECGGCLRKKYS